MKNKILIFSFLSVLLFGCSKTDRIPDTLDSEKSEESIVSSTSIKNEDITQISDDTTIESIEISDGIYRVSSIPKPEKVQLSCEYGTTYRSEGAVIKYQGKEIDFSVIPDVYTNDIIPYCICDDTKEIYFADYKNFYKSDIKMESPSIIFTMTEDESVFDGTIAEMLSFNNTDLIFFRGYTENGSCAGSLNLNTGEADYVASTSSMVTLPCNNGVVLYDYKANNTALYWENGEIYEISIQNPDEGETGAYASVNGKYLCTKLWGKTEDRKLIERYTIYDTKSNQMIKYFDWTFNKIVGDNLPNGFTFLDINEENKSIYMLNSEDGEIYQFCFGG